MVSPVFVTHMAIMAVFAVLTGSCAAILYFFEPKWRTLLIAGALVGLLAVINIVTADDLTTIRAKAVDTPGWKTQVATVAEPPKLLQRPARGKNGPYLVAVIGVITDTQQPVLTRSGQQFSAGDRITFACGQSYNNHEGLGNECWEGSVLVKHHEPLNYSAAQIAMLGLATLFPGLLVLSLLLVRRRRTDH